MSLFSPPPKKTEQVPPLPVFSGFFRSFRRGAGCPGLPLGHGGPGLGAERADCGGGAHGHVVRGAQAGNSSGGWRRFFLAQMGLFRSEGPSVGQE